MKKYILPLVISSTVVLCSSMLVSSAVAAAVGQAKLPSSLSPYVGFDVSNRYMPFQERFGRKLFKKNIQAGTIFAGVMLNEYLGFEVGFTQGNKYNGDARLDAGDYEPGKTPALQPEDAFNPDEFREYNVSSNIESWYANVSLHIPLSKNMNTKLFIAPGFTSLKIKVRTHLFNSDRGVVDLEDNFKTTKIIPNIKVGISHQITSKVDVRVFVETMRSADVSLFSSRAASDNTRYKLQLSNIVAYGVGLSLKL